MAEKTKRPPIRTTVEIKLRVAPEVREMALEGARCSESLSAYISDLVMRPRRRSVPFAPGMELRDLVDLGSRVSATLDSSASTDPDAIARLKSALLDVQEHQQRCLGKIEALSEGQFAAFGGEDLQRSLVSLGTSAQEFTNTLRALPADAKMQRAALKSLADRIDDTVTERRGLYDSASQGSSNAWRG